MSNPPEVREIVTRAYECPVCNHQYETRAQAEFCARCPYEPMAKPGDVVLLRNRSHGYTQAVVATSWCAPGWEEVERPDGKVLWSRGGRVPSDPEVLAARDPHDPDYAHDSMALLTERVCLDHKWDHYIIAVSLSVYMLDPDDPDDQARLLQGRDDNNGW